MVLTDLISIFSIVVALVSASIAYHALKQSKRVAANNALEQLFTRAIGYAERGDWGKAFVFLNAAYERRRLSGLADTDFDLICSTIWTLMKPGKQDRIKSFDDFSKRFGTEYL